MTLSIIHQKSVLVLNRHWLPVDTISIADAFCHMVASSAEGLCISDESMQAIGWTDWRKLPCDGYETVGTKGGPVRVPTVVVLTRYHGVPMSRPSFGFRALWDRDGGRCQYSGRKLAAEEADIDHIVPRSRGGRDSWDNCVISDRAINRRKGARTPEEAQLKLIRKPGAPRAVPVSARIENAYNINDWKHFIMK